MKKRWLWLILLLILLLSLGIVWFFFFRTNSTPTNTVFTPFRGWEEATQAPPLSEEEIAQLENTDGLYNHTILRGYFDSYNEETGMLKMRALVPFTYNQQYKIVELRTAPNQAVSCIPNQITDPKTQEVFPIWTISFPVMDGETLKIDLEQTSSFHQLLTKAHQGTYLIIQLLDNYQTDATNYIAKLIAAGICD